MSDDHEDDGSFVDGADLSSADSGRENRFQGIPRAKVGVDHGQPPDAALARIRALQENRTTPARPATVEGFPGLGVPEQPRPPREDTSPLPDWIHEARGKMQARRKTVTVVFGAGEIDLQCVDITQDERHVTVLVSRDAVLRLQPTKELVLRIEGEDQGVTYLGIRADFHWLPFLFMAFVKNPKP